MRAPCERNEGTRKLHAPRDRFLTLRGRKEQPGVDRRPSDRATRTAIARLVDQQPRLERAVPQPVRDVRAGAGTRARTADCPRGRPPARPGAGAMSTGQRLVDRQRAGRRRLPDPLAVGRVGAEGARRSRSRRWAGDGGDLEGDVPGDAGGGGVLAGGLDGGGRDVAGDDRRGGRGQDRPRGPARAAPSRRPGAPWLGQRSKPKRRFRPGAMWRARSACSMARVPEPAIGSQNGRARARRRPGPARRRPASP